MLVSITALPIARSADTSQGGPMAAPSATNCFWVTSDVVVATARSMEPLETGAAMVVDASSKVTEISLRKYARMQDAVYVYRLCV
jgi:hypothetical protein